MAQKDFTVTENQDRSPAGSDCEDQDLRVTEKNSDEKEAGEKTEVKNAHATGDGSYGRSDGSLPEQEPKAPATDNQY